MADNQLTQLTTSLLDSQQEASVNLEKYLQLSKETKRAKQTRFKKSLITRDEEIATENLELAAETEGKARKRIAAGKKKRTQRHQAAQKGLMEQPTLPARGAPKGSVSRQQALVDVITAILESNKRGGDLNA